MTAVDVAAIRAYTERAALCCEHCPQDPEWHADNPKDTHDTSCVNCDRDNAGLRDALEVAVSRAEVAETALARVEELHPTSTIDDPGGWLGRPGTSVMCKACNVVWPCPTVAAVRGDAT